MKEEEIHDELATIRGLMERSSKFISLSGLSGILAGVYALVGVGVAYLLIQKDAHQFDAFIKKLSPEEQKWFGSPPYNSYTSASFVQKLTLIALLVLIASVLTAIFFSRRQAARKNQPMWGPASKSLLFHMAVPLITGGTLILIILFVNQYFASPQHYELIIPVMLIFYGLSLVSASNFTFNMVKYLGLCEIALGLIAACLPGYGLLFWAFGFGVLHIIYGSMMYLKYDR